jgi:pimeloyl-ACP methyl ester carboxylesterase
MDLESLWFVSSDQVKIHANFFGGRSGGNAKLIIVAPGFAQHSGTRSMRALAAGLIRFADVLIVDFRGTGKSAARFTFGAEEHRDLEPVLRWAERYATAHLLGFSLGAYHALAAWRAYPGVLKSLLLVSCPTRLAEIFTSGGALLNPLALLTRRVTFVYPAQNNLWFRYGWPFTRMPSAREFAAHLQIPAHFLAGGADTLVFESLTRQVFDAAPTHKTYTRFEQGLHAEWMYLQLPADFLDWVRRSLY